MKVLILGSNGMLGGYIKNFCIKNNIYFLEGNKSNNENFNYLNPNRLLNEIENYSDIDCIINCNAITSFELCENEQDIAFQINTITPAILAEFCKLNSLKFVHISTDHYYSGKKIDHSELDKITIFNQYAHSKREAEIRIKKNNPSALITRTAIIGRNKYGNSFLDWAFKAANGKENVNLFEDAYTSLIHCSSFVRLLFDLIEANCQGIINVGSSEVFSKAEFCIALFKALKSTTKYQLSSVQQLNTKRANSCGLNIEKLKSFTSHNIPTMKDTVGIAIEEDQSLFKRV